MAVELINYRLHHYSLHWAPGLQDPSFHDLTHPETVFFLVRGFTHMSPYSNKGMTSVGMALFDDTM